MGTANVIDAKYHEVTVPIPGASFVKAVTGAAGSVDLRLIGNQTQDISDSSKTEIGAQKNYIDVQNDGNVNLYVSFGVTAPTPNPAAAGPNAAGNCYMIPPGGTLPGYYLRPGADLFIGHICGTAAGGSGNTVMRIFQTSRFG